MGSKKKELNNTQDMAMRLFGPEAKNLKLISKLLGLKIGQRGGELHLYGAPPEILALAQKIINALGQLVAQGQTPSEWDVECLVAQVQNQPEVKLDNLAEETGASAWRKVYAKTECQRAYIECIKNHDLVFGLGPAGTGKTYLAVALAVQALAQGSVKRLIITRPAVEAGERLGFLPGDLAEKVNPYLRPIYDALDDLIPGDKYAKLTERRLIEVAPLAFMRGRTLSGSFVILDEAQNATCEQMKMFLTRLGPGSKAVVTGDMSQSDLAKNIPQGLEQAVNLLSNVPGIGFCLFSAKDVIRHHLVKKIIEAYEGAGF